MIIAIDGNSASGKGTIARRVAGWYGLPYMDTGLLYRAAGFAALKAGAAFDDAPALAKIASTLDLHDCDENVSRSADAPQAASKGARMPAVRAALFDLQRSFATRASYSATSN